MALKSAQKKVNLLAERKEIGKMAKCGRKKKPVLSLEEQEDAALEKLYEPCLDKDGNVYFERSDRTLQLDEIAVLLWMMEGRKTAKPMSKMGVEKIL